MARILIAGCGDVGTHLGCLLSDHGHKVWGLRRHPEVLPSQIQPLAGDLADSRTLTQLPLRIDALYYTSAASEYSDAGYQSAYVDGVNNILKNLDRSNLTRVMFVSSTGVYAQSDGSEVDESSLTEPQSFSGIRLLEGEAMARTSEVTTIAVRFGGIYGPGRGQFLERVRQGASCCETPPQWTNRIHRDDCAGVLAFLLTLQSPAPVYIGVDHESVTQCEVMDWMAEQLKAPLPERTPPKPRARGSNKRCSSQLLRDSGYKFKYETYRQGYSKIIEDLKTRSD